MLIIATCLVGLLAAAAQAQDCGGGFFGDANGCCPTLLNGLAYFRDARGCYPIALASGVFYADTNGCYPNANVHIFLSPTHTHTHTVALVLERRLACL
jgi:hypothetical protein